MRSGMENAIRRKKSFHGYHFRRRTRTSIDQYNSSLRNVIGLTVKSNISFTCDPLSGTIAYPAGCIIVIYSPSTGNQTHIMNSAQKTLTCLRFSMDGSYIVTGETGHCPYVRIFCVQDKSEVAAFKSHMFGISCVAFSPNGNYLISIGDQHDNVINVWDWKHKTLAASNKVSIDVQSIAFAEDNSLFVTVGKSHVKFWYLEESVEAITSEGTIPLKGRSAILGSYQHQLVCDVVCGVGSDSDYTFALTRSGTLCQFHRGRIINNSVQIKCTSAQCMCIVTDMVLCGCSAGVIHVYSSRTLDFITTILPPNDQNQSDVIALSMDPKNMWLHCVTNDHSIIIWDVINIHAPVVHKMHNFHSSCVWDIKMVSGHSSFFTCSNDCSVRLWNLNDSILMHQLLIPQASIDTEDKSIKTGIRCLCVQNDGSRLAVGDRQGNIHTFALLDGIPDKQLAKVMAHTGDILCMDYTPNNNSILASAGRDRCINTWDDNHSPMHTIADHSAAVTAVKIFTHEEQIRMTTCGADKSLYFCTMSLSGEKTEISRDQHVVAKHSMHDMALTDSTVIVACGTSLHEYDIATSKRHRVISGRNSSATILRVAIDSKKELLAVSCADKYIYLLSYQGGDFISVICGHSDVCTALEFSDDGTTLVSSFADSCVFIWNLSKFVKDDLLKILRGPELQENQTESTLITRSSSEHDVSKYFGEPILSSSILVRNETENNESLPSNKTYYVTNNNQAEHPQIENDKSNSTIVKPSTSGKSSLSTSKSTGMLNVSLPSWITGNAKPQEMKTKALPVKGKWAGRLQNPFANHTDDCSCIMCTRNNVDESDEEDSNLSDNGCLLLETPRCDPEWGFSDLDQDEHETTTKHKQPSSVEIKENCENKTIPEKTDENSQGKTINETASKNSSSGNVSLASQSPNASNNTTDQCNSPQEFKTFSLDRTSEYHSAQDMSDEEIDIRSVVHGRNLSSSGDRPQSAPSYVSKFSMVIKTPEIKTKKVQQINGDSERHKERPLSNENQKDRSRKDSLKSTASDSKVHYSQQKTHKNFNKAMNAHDNTNTVDEYFRNLLSVSPRKPSVLAVNSNYGSNHSTPILKRNGNNSNHSTPRMSNFHLSPKSIMGNQNGNETTSESDEDSTNLSVLNCKKTVNRLIHAFDQAEAMYKQASDRSQHNHEISQQERRKILKSFENTLISLKDRIEQLQIDMSATSASSDLFRNLDNTSPVFELLKDYSNKLFNMVQSEFQKQVVFEE